MRQIPISILLIISIMYSVNLSAQSHKPVQNIRGVVTDHDSGSPLSFVSVGLLDVPGIGATTDNEGKFIIRNVPVGRHDLQATFVEYEPAVYRELMLTSAKEVYLEIQLKESVQQLDEVVIRPRINKEEPLNCMALSGARMLSVEEAGRFAGGMDDPSRLVSSLAGVASAVGSNGISVHGNAPSLLQWRLEEIEIPNPNHFADVASLGGGVLSSLSSNVLGNSDFYTSAFPAEYNNAVSGVFDMKLRNGNNQKFQHTLQAGILGLDVASEGPLSKKHNASYLFNYRYHYFQSGIHRLSGQPHCIGKQRLSHLHFFIRALSGSDVLQLLLSDTQVSLKRQVHRLCHSPVHPCVSTAHAIHRGRILGAKRIRFTASDYVVHESAHLD